MTLTPGTELGAYRITGLLGAGGMGEVYRARDARLGRDVAIKVLAAVRLGDPERRARFEREARVLAALNHPHVGAIYGVEEAGDSAALVLELIEGPTLAERLERGPLSIAAAIETAIQIASAIEAAHGRGIVHRDLKPANVILRGAAGARRAASSTEARAVERDRSDEDPFVKVVDFGIAKEAATAGDAVATDAPTLAAATREGVLLGTVAYMSPEQARGEPVDERTDLWAIGCVLYEMLTGRRPFDGTTVPDTLAAILGREPDWSALPPALPEPVRRLLRRCLEKDRRRRLQNAGDLRIELEEARDETVGAPASLAPAPKRRRRAAIAVLSAVALAAVAGVLGWSLGRTAAPVAAPEGGPAAGELRLEISTPPTSDPVSLAISPDGGKVAFVASSEGRTLLWVRALDTASARALPGTDGASFPFWSPDGRAIGFFADRKLKRVDVDVGAVQMLARADGGRGGTWGKDDTIVFQPVTTGPALQRIAASGGDPVPLPALLGRFPQFLPDGVHFLYHGFTFDTPTRGVFLATIDGAAPLRLLDADTAAVYASGHLLFVRGSTLLAQRFDPNALTLSGAAFPVASGMVVDETIVAAPLSASPAGPIVFRAGTRGGRRRFVWVDRSGRELGQVRDFVDASLSPSLSPDGKRIAFHRTVNGSIGVWLLETERGVVSRLGTDPGNQADPIWSPDGNRVAYGAGDGIYERSIAAGEPRRLVETSGQAAASDWSPDGRVLLYYTFDQSSDLWIAPLDGGEKPYPFAATEFLEIDGQFSPDGRWIAYTSDESGEPQVYLKPFRGSGGARLQASTAGGTMPRFGRDGELFYVALDGKLMAVELRRPSGAGGEIAVLPPLPLFDAHLGESLPPNSKQQYMVSPDGKRFLLDRLVDEEAPPITVIVGWNPRS